MSKKKKFEDVDGVAIYRVVTRKTYVRRPEFYEDQKGLKSETIPDQTMSIKELIARYTRGQLNPVGLLGTGYENEADIPMDLPDFGKMDFFDKVAFAEENAGMIEAIKERIDMRVADYDREQEELRMKEDENDDVEVIDEEN